MHRSSTADCGNSWCNVFHEMYDEDDGMLRCYRKFKGARNFRTGLVEKVLKKVQNMVVVNNANNHKTPDDIVELDLIADSYFHTKRVGDENMSKKKETTKKNKEKMAESEDNMNLIPKPAHVDAPSLSDDSENLFSDFGKVNIGNPKPPDSIDIEVCPDFGDVKVVTESQNNNKKRSWSNLEESVDIGDFGHPTVRTAGTEECPMSPKLLTYELKTPKCDKKVPSTVSSKKVKRNRNIEVEKFFDSNMPHMDSMFQNIVDNMKALPAPFIEQKKEKNDVKKLDNLLNLKERLVKHGLATDKISIEIETLLKTMF